MNQDEQDRPHDSRKSVDHCVKRESDYSGDIEIAALLRVIWRRKVWIVAATSIITTAAIVYALTATQWYRAEAVLMPRDIGVGAGLLGQLGQLGGLASMAGISLGQTSKQEPMGVLRSIGFARRFVEQQGLESVLSQNLSKESASGESTARPKVEQLVEIFQESIFTVTEDKKTGLVTVIIEWKDPAVAAKWANAIHRQLNEEIRQRALDESTRNVRYLQEQLESTEMVSLQQAIARLIESEMQKLMLAQGTDEYAFRVLDAAQPTFKRSRPKRTALVIAAFLGSLFASIIAAVMFDPLRSLWREAHAGEA